MEFLDYVTQLLAQGGIRVGEEYPAGRWVHIETPLAAVGLRGMDFDGGQVQVNVRVLSPRVLGGRRCQQAALEVLTVLHGAGVDCRMEEMEFLEGSDCFCITVTAALDAVFGADWALGKRWRITCGGEALEQVTSFRAVRDQGRRVVGAFCQSEGVSVTPGRGAWELTLVQSGGEDVQEEPFALTLEDGDRSITYTGCHWNREEWDHHQGGSRRTRTGFALGREVTGNG